MPLPKGPNPGGVPQRPGAGLPQPGGGGLPQPNLRPQVPTQNNPAQRPQQNLPEPPREDNYAAGMDRLSEYDFGAREVDREPLNKNLRDAEPELTFDDILGPDEEEDSYEVDRAREISERKARETAHRFDRSMEEKAPSKKPKNNVLKPQAGELDDKGQNVFLDKKNKKVEPFGGKKSSIKVNDLDRRKNMRQNATIVKVVVIGLCLVTLGFAAKNAFMPPTGITESDVQSIVYDTTGTTAFPLQQGGFFAESFMEAYLEYDPNNGDSNSIMQYYTTGVLGSGGAVVPGTVYGKNFKQTVINGPVVYNSQEASDNSAIYTVGALVKVENIVPGSAEVPVNNASGAPDGTGLGSSASGSLVWKFFAINVYHNAETNAFAIASAPTVVPAPDTIKTSEVPAAAPYGTGEAAKEDAIKAVTPTIYGFLSAYREASPAKPDQLLPFLGSDPDKTLLTGLNGGYEFKGGKANEESVTISGWGTGTDAVKAILTVTWVQNVSGSFVETQSSYVMDIQPVSGGYRVTRFLPLAYVPES